MSQWTPERIAEVRRRLPNESEYYAKMNLLRALDALESQQAELAAAREVITEADTLHKNIVSAESYMRGFVLVWTPHLSEYHTTPVREALNRYHTARAEQEAT